MFPRSFAMAVLVAAVLLLDPEARKVYVTLRRDKIKRCPPISAPVLELPVRCVVVAVHLVRRARSYLFRPETTRRGTSVERMVSPNCGCPDACFSERDR